MARDTALLANRNKQILADFNRLKGHEYPFKVQGRTVYVRLKREQIIPVLCAIYHLSPRTMEALVYEIEPKPAPIQSAA